MAVDHPGQHRGLPEINLLGTRRRLTRRRLDAPGRANVGDPVASNNDHLIAQQLVGSAIEELPGMNHYRALSLNLRARAGEGESKRQTNEPTHLHRAASESQSR